MNIKCYIGSLVAYKNAGYYHLNSKKEILYTLLMVSRWSILLPYIGLSTLACNIYTSCLVCIWWTHVGDNNDDILVNAA